MALEDLAGSALSVTIIVIFAVVMLGLFGLGYWLYLRRKLYAQFVCIVWERDGFNQLRQKYDSAGIFVDKKTNNKRFFMKKANVGLEPDNVPYIPGPDGKNYVYLIRTGLKNFRYVRPNINADGGLTFTVGEEDVNWSINAYERQKKMFSNNMLMQYLPFILLAFVSIVILIIFIYFFRHFGDLRLAAEALKEASVNLAAAKAGTTILPA